MVETEADGSVAAGPEPGPDIQRTLGYTCVESEPRVGLNRTAPCGM